MCSTPGCPNLRPCPTHLAKAWSTSDRRSRLPKDWERIRRIVLRRDGGRCQSCGALANQVDHVTAGDDHSPSNLQALCEPCHQRKTNAER